jgi:AraC-like DNA-binding protein
MKYHQENFYGNYEFRCKAHTDWCVESHLHEYSELLYCKEGRLDVLVNGKAISLPRGHILWLPPNYIHQYLGSPSEVVCAVFSNDYIPLFFHLVGQKRLCLTPVAAQELTELLEALPSHTGDNPLLISGWLNLICAKVLENTQLIRAGQGDEILYQKVISHIAAHFREDITLKGLARELGYNEKYLSHLLHGLTGMHFSKLLALYRVEHAKKLLAERHRNISDIAVLCGFSAINTFNRVFKAMTGKTPSQYRDTGSYV